MRYREIVSEAPIGDWQVDPDLDKNEKEMISQFHGYDKEQKHWPDMDKAAIRNDLAIKQVKSGFLKTPFTFNLYFYQSTNPDYDPFMQRGLVDADWMNKMMGTGAAKRVADMTKPNEITVVMSNNMSDEGWISIRSPWMVAHRIAHTIIQGEARMAEGYEVLDLFHQFVIDFTSIAYGIKWPDQDDRYGSIFHDDYITAYVPIIGYMFGTMRSARNKKFTNTSEWIMETFAQYLITGKITFNDKIPETLDGHEALTTNPRRLAKAKKLAAEFPAKAEAAMTKMLHAACGHVWVI